MNTEDDEFRRIEREQAMRAVPDAIHRTLQMAFNAMSYGNAQDRESARLAVKAALADQPAKQPAQQEPVANALYFGQWTAADKDLSDYICVGSLCLAGIEDGEYGQSESDLLENTIEALQESLVTGTEHKKVPLLAYIGALNITSQPARKPLTLQELEAAWNAQADKFNQWDELGLDEIVAWAQAAHNIKEQP